jgi:hypothetical protein
MTGSNPACNLAIGLLVVSFTAATWEIATKEALFMAFSSYLTARLRRYYGGGQECGLSGRLTWPNAKIASPHLIASVIRSAAAQAAWTSRNSVAVGPTLSDHPQARQTDPLAIGGDECPAERDEHIGDRHSLLGGVPGGRLTGRHGNKRHWRRVWSQLGGCGMMT